MKELYAVVTGASRGLGLAFAKEFAKRNINVILISLPGEGLEGTCRYLSNHYSIRAEYYETDLTCKDNLMSLANRINNNYNIHYLINNAGMGGTKRFDEASPAYLDSIIQLNITATSLLTHQLLSNLKRQEKAYVLNVSSLAAFSPIGYKTVYPASKAFVHSFSRGLYQELRDSNVFVSVVNPGPMKTNEEVTRRIESQGFFASITALDPDRVAAYCLDRLPKRDTVIMVNRFSWLILWLFPIWLKLPLLTNTIKREIKLTS